MIIMSYELNNIKIQLNENQLVKNIKGYSVYTLMQINNDGTFFKDVGNDKTHALNEFTKDVTLSLSLSVLKELSKSNPKGGVLC